MAYFGDSPHGDFDTSGKLEEILGRTDLLPKARVFIASLGFRFPLPLGPETCACILNLQAFPTKVQWEDFNLEYSDTLYTEDRHYWQQQALKSKTYEELYRWVQRANQRIKFMSIPAQAAYARSILSYYKAEVTRLGSFYMTSSAPLDGIAFALSQLGTTSTMHLPELTQNKKKLRRATIDAVADQASRKKKTKKNIDQVDMFV